jgi:zinc transport system ATP-binding protein
MNPILNVDRLTVEFDSTRVLTDLSFSVNAGELLAIIGPNGAGKTVLLRTLIGAIPFTGTVRWAPGTRIGYVPQKLDLDRDVPITGFDFLGARVALARRRALSISSVLAQVGLPPEVASRPIGELSGGQFQRILIAFALVGDPTVLLLDEPTAGVDLPGEERINELVHRLQQREGLTVLVISHELSIVDRYATHVLCLGGAHPCFGPPGTLLTPETLRNLYGAEVKVHVHDH